MLKNPFFRGFFKCEENDREFCCDAEKDETLCETCRFYEESHGIPTCCGNEYEERLDITLINDPNDFTHLFDNIDELTNIDLSGWTIDEIRKGNK